MERVENSAHDGLCPAFVRRLPGVVVLLAVVSERESYADCDRGFVARDSPVHEHELIEKRFGGHVARFAGAFG